LGVQVASCLENRRDKAFGGRGLNGRRAAANMLLENQDTLLARST
jgi:hypothetical protein